MNTKIKITIIGMMVMNLGVNAQDEINRCSLYFTNGAIKFGVENVH